eukprot:gene24261-30581_t
MVDTAGNFVFEEILNAVSHGIGFLGAVIGANLLISEAADVYRTDYHFWACVLYSFSLLFLFLSSCLFHSFFMLPSKARFLLTVEWTAAVLGSAFAACADLNAPTTTMVELTVFISMGLGMLTVWPLLVAELCSAAITLTVLGTVFYGVGIIFYLLGEYKPIYH